MNEKGGEEQRQKVYRETNVDGQTDRETDKRTDRYGETQVGVETEREDTHKRQGGQRETER